MIKKQLNIDISDLTFLLTLSFGFIFYYWGFEGLLFSDDFSYAEKANRLLHGNWNLGNDIMEHRVGVTIPLAGLYYLFGVNDISTNILPFLAYIGILVVIFLCFRTNLPLVIAVALIMAGLNYYFIYFSNKLFPDTILSLFAFLSLLFLLKRDTNSNWLMAFGFIGSFFYGFLVKETILYLLPFYVFIFIRDLIKKYNNRFWISSFIAIILLFGIYFYCYFITKGNPFYRFEIIMDGHYVSGGSYFDKSFSILLDRLSYQPIVMLINSELIIPMLLGLTLLFQWNSLLKEEKYWLLASIIILFTFWFGTTSLRFYNPIVLNPRMFILIVPLWAMVAAYAYQRAIDRPGMIISFIVSFLIVALISYFYFNNIKLTIVYVLVSIYFLLFYFVIVKSFFHPYVIIGLFAVLLLHPVYIVLNNSRGNYSTLKLIFQKDLNLKGSSVAVLTDPITQYGYQYFYQFKDLPSLKVYSYLEMDKFKADSSQKKFFLVEDKNVNELILAGDPVPEIFYKPMGDLIAQRRGPGIALYRIR